MCLFIKQREVLIHGAWRTGFRLVGSLSRKEAAAHAWCAAHFRSELYSMGPSVQDYVELSYWFCACSGGGGGRISWWVDEELPVP